jgi:transcriptional regulator with XRE-family HTH domain
VAWIHAGLELPDEVRERLRKEVDRQFPSHYKAAERMGISAHHLSRILRGAGKPSATMLGKITDALGLDVVVIVTKRGP